jgi:mannose-6-phosphate isomerase-like protein (cupin superfamily)
MMRVIQKLIQFAFLIAAIDICAIASIAQKPAVSTRTSSQMETLESSLRKQAAAGDGLATAFIEKYPQYYTQLIVRTKSGEVEIHQQFDEMAIILDGHATVLTGGNPQNVRVVRPGEQRASTAPGGAPTAMAKGALLYIPVSTPHQVIVPPGGFVAYLDVKIAHP